MRAKVVVTASMKRPRARWGRKVRDMTRRVIAQTARSCGCVDPDCRANGCQLERGKASGDVDVRHAASMEITILDRVDASELLRLLGGKIKVHRTETGSYLVIGPL